MDPDNQRGPRRALSHARSLFSGASARGAALAAASSAHTPPSLAQPVNAGRDRTHRGIEEIEDSSLAEYYESFDAGDLEADADVDNADWPVNRRFREALEEHGLDEEEDLDELIGDPDEDSQAEDDFDQTDHDKSELQDAVPVNLFDAAAMGLKEINNLAHFSVSSHKPGNGVEELLHDDLDKYWQSDGQQPHLLTIHFLRRVEIRAIRFYVDYSQDESYTPTFVVFSAGTGHHDLVEFASLPLSSPIGWQDIDLSGVGGGDDGRSLCCWIVQMQVKENHQNGKDTHIRGIKLYALDESVAGGAYEEGALREVEHLIDESPRRQRQQSTYHGLDEEDAELYFLSRSPGKSGGDGGFGGMGIPDFMREPEIR